jgi:hypothetical protein
LVPPAIIGSSGTTINLALFVLGRFRLLFRPFSVYEFVIAS